MASAPSPGGGFTVGGVARRGSAVGGAAAGPKVACNHASCSAENGVVGPSAILLVAVLVRCGSGSWIC